MKILISFLTALLITVLIITYVKISKPEYKSTKKTEVKKNEFNLSNEKILNLSFNSFNFPARELFIKIDFRKFKNVVLYKITINANDEYAVFNIKAILENENVAYSMIEKKKTEIYALFESLAQAERIIKIFKNYKFNINIKKIIKRI